MTRTLAQQAVDRELAALVDGPFRLRWYWRDELEAMQEASRRIGYPDDHPAARMRGYQPSDARIPHPQVEGVEGRAWHYRPGESS